MMETAIRSDETFTDPQEYISQIEWSLSSSLDVVAIIGTVKGDIYVHVCWGGAGRGMEVSGWENILYSV